MAYYPGNYYQTRLWHVGDYHSHGLFGPIAVHGTNKDIDPYEDSHPTRPDNHHRSHPPSSSSLRAHTTRHPSNDPPLSSTYPREQSPLTNPCARARTPTPSPPPSPRPSSAYLEFASTPSKTLSAPTRKLLVLDLNGTLLLRSPRPPKSYRGRGHHQHPAPRRVMRRPYLTTLRAYLFASQTRAWLDVMVWSSAQPHSVEDMVLHAFGKDRAWLVATWARDTLGLGEDHYYRKVQTIKDLEKPWAFLEPRSPASPTGPVLPPEPKSKLPPAPPPTWTGHSAATTLLLDDSFAKAARQPYNHLPVLEYTRAQRNADLASLHHLSLASTISFVPVSPKEHEEDTSEAPASAPSPDGSKENPRKRKRQKEKQQLVVRVDDQADDDSGAQAPVHPVPDETLLAVIGILHAARMQSSIAGWLRAGVLQPERGGGAAWYEDPASVRAWARRGRQAMHELRLEVEHGVEP